MSLPAFTVGIPVTRTRFLAESLASLTAQTSRCFEIHVVDNVADGDVAAIVRQFPDLRVVFFRRSQRLGPVANWNEMLRNVTTPWFILLSDDDYFQPEHIERAERLIAAWPGVDVAHTRVRVVDEHRRTLLITSSLPAWESAVEFLWHRVGGHRIQFLSEFIWRVEALRSVGGFQEMPQAWGTDDLSAFLLARRGGIAYHGTATLNYRRHGGSITGSFGVAGKMQALEILTSNYCRELARLDLTCDSQDEELRRDIPLQLPAYRRRHQVYLLRNGSWRELFVASLARRRLGADVTLERGVLIRAWVHRFLAQL